MTTQRDRLAEVLTEAAAYVSPATHGRPERIEHELWLAGAIASIDALLARGVRVVDADTLAAAVSKVQCGWEVEHRFAILAALDAEVD